MAAAVRHAAWRAAGGAIAAVAPERKEAKEAAGDKGKEGKDSKEEQIPRTRLTHWGARCAALPVLVAGVC
jgi:hypothetical protein